MKKQNVRTLSFIVSTFTYLLIGAAIFDALESQTEENIKNELEKTEDAYKTQYNISYDDYRTLEEIVIKYHPYRKFPQWKFTGAFYFSLTVITTIGYGHSTPQTVPGKSFCMLYAIIGIPLCLVMFQSVGDRLNYFASFCIQLVKKCIRFKNTEVNQTEMVCVAGVLSFFVITGGAAMFSHYEGWTYFNAIYYCVITLTTIGFGDFVALQDRNDLSNTVYVILSFTFILFGLTVVASSINLLVLKFLTMNTDDERREEFTKKVQKNNNIRFSSTDLLNVVNGNVICTYEPSDLEELRRENSIRFCFTNKKSYCFSFKRQFPFIEWKSKSIKTDQNSMYTLGRIKQNQNNHHHHHEDHDKYLIDRTDSQSLDLSNNNRIERKQVLCTFCLNNLKSKKSHYTIRRGPGKISHLLLANNNQIDLNAKLHVESPKICLTKINDSVLNINDSYENKNEQNKPSLNYDINVYIDDDNDQDDYLTMTNATILTTLTKPEKSNSDNKHLGQKQSTPVEPNSDTKFNFLTANYLSTTSIKKTSNNDLSSQNITDYDISYDKSRLDDESSLNDADDMVSSSKKFLV